MLVFTSGYVSNQTGIATIARLLPDCLILSDALNHNSMIEGMRGAGCAKQIWRHNDLEHRPARGGERRRTARRNGKGTVGAGTLGVHATLGNHFARKMGQLFDQPDILQERRPSWSGGLNVEVVRDRRTRRMGQGGRLESLLIELLRDGWM